MTRGSARLRRCRSFILALLVSMATFCGAAAEDYINIKLDQAQVARLPTGVATIVVGNPLIADVSLQQGGIMVLTGKGYGVTNLLALDRGGTLLSQQFIRVQGPTDGVLVVYRGVERETYSCTPRCDRRITLGDSPDFFDVAIGQTGVRNLRAQGGAAPQPQGGGTPPR